MSSFTHLDDRGRVRMVDVSEKPATTRKAVARGWITMSPETLSRIRESIPESIPESTRESTRESTGEPIGREGMKKGNVLETARIAGIMAAKKTADLIPMCHPLSISHAQVDFFFEPDGRRIRIEAAVRLVGQTGVEMEALTAVSIAALTIYDMCKSHDRGMSVSEIVLTEKTGGKSGSFVRKP